MEKRETGAGIVHATTDSKGHVSEVSMAKSTGSKILDEATLQMARAQWQGPPNASTNVPIEYRLPPVIARQTQAKARSGWKIPAHKYPFEASDSYEQGRGVVRATTNEKGRVVTAVVVRSTGHKRLDEDAVQNALANWKGPASALAEVPVVYRLDTDKPVIPPSTDGKTWHLPTPYYPVQARANWTTGSGVLRVTTDGTGHVVRAVVLRSTGSALLDENIVNYALARWSGPPNGETRVPMTYRIQR